MNSFRKYKNLIAALVVVAVAALLSWSIIRHGLERAPSPPAASAPAGSKSGAVQQENKIIPLPQGKQTFSVSLGTSQKGPRLTEGFIDPYDPKIGETQTISISANDTKPILSVTVTMKTDNGAKEYPMKLVEGSELSGRFEGSWRVTDSHDRIYRAVIAALSANGSSSIEITL